MKLLDDLRAAWYGWRQRRAIRRVGTTYEKLGSTCEEVAANLNQFVRAWRKATKGSRVMIGPPHR